QFCVDWTDNQASASRTITGRLTLDGIFCGGQLMEIQRGNPTFSTAFRSSVVVSELTRRPLLFSKQALTDDDEYLNASISPHLGTIRLRIIHVRITGHSPPGPLDQVKCETPILHEKSKKAVGHSVQFGAEYQTNSLNTVTKTCLVKELVTFVFKYRPIELLQAEGIAPPPVREKRAVSPTDVLDLTLDVDEDDEDEAKIKKLEVNANVLREHACCSRLPAGGTWCIEEQKEESQKRAFRRREEGDQERGADFQTRRSDRFDLTSPSHGLFLAHFGDVGSWKLPS
ncbi:hypothetical protein B0H11DRAFT_1996658, partial [Mycena galericulata]